MASLRRRAAARILLFDETGRVLLFHEVRSSDARDSRDSRDWWYTPGGGIDPGETAELAARRELLEETGIAPESLAGPILQRRIRFVFDGEEIDQDEVFFAAWVGGSATVRVREGDLESTAIGRHRWWSAGELVATDQTVFPAILGDIVEAILRDGVPAQPWAVNEP